MFGNEFHLKYRVQNCFIVMACLTPPFLHLLHETSNCVLQILDLPGRKRINVQLFSVIAALSEKVAQVE